jgi:xylulokinase
VSAALGAERLHRETGKYPNLTPVLYRLNWLRREEPATLDAAAKILDVHGYLTGRLTGAPTASWTSADPFGVFDLREKRWSAPILDWLGLTPDRFARLVAPGAHVGDVTAAAAAQTGLAEGTPIFAGGGDGQCAGVGVNGARKGVVCLNLGTAIITAAWAAEPRINAYWRTMTSPTGEGYFLEGCQRAGTYLVDWFVDGFAGGRDAPDRAALFAKLEAMAAEIPIGAEGALVCPYLTGCMDPHWDADARASISGLGPHHGLGHLYRAVLEALTLEIARCVDAMREQGLAPERIVAVGGGAASALWRRMLADATGLPLAVSTSLEASSAGAAMAAAAGAGWYGSIAEAAAGMASESAPTDPDPSVRDAWAALSRKQAAAYRPATERR